MSKTQYISVEHQSEIDELDIYSLKVDDLDQRTTGLIIGLIREKLQQLNEKPKNIDYILDIELNNIIDKTSTNIIEILELPIHKIQYELKTNQDLILFILGLTFDDIENIFLSHPFNREIFLEGTKEFLDYKEEETK